MTDHKFFNHLEPFRAIILAGKVNTLQTVIQSQERNSKPELKEICGYSQAEYINRLENDLEELQKDIKQNCPLRLCDITRMEALNYLRAESFACRRRAIDFPNNPWIIMRNLRKAVRIAQVLIKVEPRLEIYSLHWISNATKINLNLETITK